jgi:hypothetical protein
MHTPLNPTQVARQRFRINVYKYLQNVIGEAINQKHMQEIRNKKIQVTNSKKRQASVNPRLIWKSNGADTARTTVWPDRPNGLFAHRVELALRRL